MLPFSILDLAPIIEGCDAGQALRNALDLARHGERLGYRRFWMAEHHSMPGIASAATAVALAYVGAGTSTIRIGAGGIMLPNHSPLVIAEQFGTLESLYPGPDRPRPRPGARHRPGGGPRAAPQPRLRRQPVPARRRRADRLFPRRRGPAGPGDPGRRPRRSRSGSSDRACSARSSRRCSACPSPSPPISRRRR